MLYKHLNANVVEIQSFYTEYVSVLYVILCYFMESTNALLILYSKNQSHNSATTKASVQTIQIILAALFWAPLNAGSSADSPSETVVDLCKQRFFSHSMQNISDVAYSSLLAAHLGCNSDHIT